MKNQFSCMDSLVIQHFLHNRELSQKKNEITQQIKVCRADIAEKRSYIETVSRNIKKLEDDIRVKQSTLKTNKASAKSLKATNSLLLQYEHTLKAELESAKESFKHDMEVYNERILSYRKIYQSHKEYYCQNPLAQKLLTLQVDKEELEFRIKACDDQITMKQMELDILTCPALHPSSTETLPDSVSGQQLITESEEELDPHTEDDDDDSSVHMSSLQLNQNKETAAQANAEKTHDENKVQDAATCSVSSEETSKQSSPEEIPAEEQQEENGPGNQEKHSAVSEVKEAVEDGMEEGAAAEEEQEPSKDDHEGSTAAVKNVSSTPTFPFHLSPGRSPHQENSSSKSPAFVFALNSDPSTPSFSGFGFDMGSSQEEDSSFLFSGSFFNEKKTTESKSSGPDFLFAQPEQSGDFQFTFNSNSPQTSSKENAMDDFPFSFNF